VKKGEPSALDWLSILNKRLYRSYQQSLCGFLVFSFGFRHALGIGVHPPQCIRYSPARNTSNPFDHLTFSATRGIVFSITINNPFFPSGPN
jgi:hypothetical protein